VTSWPPQSPATVNNIPAIGYRVINGRIWWLQIYPYWKHFSAARSTATRTGSHVVPPLLSKRGGKGVYFTDDASLQGMQDEMDFARRAGLSQSSAQACYLYGCVVVAFDTAAFYSDIMIPTPHSTCRPGLTVGGAREWLIPSNVPVYLDEQMTVMCYHSGRLGHVSFDLVL
jgi:hypothetical protein